MPRLRPLRARTTAFLIAVGGAVALAACVTSPTGRSQLMLFPDETMTALGLSSFESLKEQQPISQDAAKTRYVQCIAQALTARLPAEQRDGWEVVLFEEPSANAFALPGRRIGVHTGLLSVAVNQDQVAAVMGHEVAHVLAGHGNERMSQQYASQIGLQAVSVLTDTTTTTGKVTMAALGLGTQFGVLLPFSRVHESEADVMGLDLMADAGFDPGESVALWRNMGRAAGGQAPPEFLSTHPSHTTRIKDLQAGLAKANEIRERARQAGRSPRCATGS